MVRGARGRLVTSMFKWTPDHMVALRSFKKAATAFERAKDLARASDSWERAALSAEALKMGDSAPTHYEASLKNAVAGLSSAKGEAARRLQERVLRVAQSGAEAALAQGDATRAAQMQASAALGLRATDAAASERLFFEAVQAFREAGAAKATYAVRALKEYPPLLVEAGAHAAAMRAYKEMMPFYAQLKQDTNLHRCVVARVALLLAGGDVVAADAEMRQALDVPGFAASDECRAMEEIVHALQDSDAEALTRARTRHHFLKYLERPIAALVASGIAVAGSAGDAELAEAVAAVTGSGTPKSAAAAAVPGGRPVPVAKAGQGASAGLDYVPSAATASDLGLDGFGPAIRYGGHGADLGVTQAPSDRKKAEDDERARSLLFSSSAPSAAGAASRRVPQPRHDDDDHDDAGAGDDADGGGAARGGGGGGFDDDRDGEEGSVGGAGGADGEGLDFLA
jgi:hypothetical protein